MKKINKIEVMTRTMEDESGKLRSFSYYLLVEEIETQGFFCENYGVAVQEKQGDISQICAITSNRERIETLISLLARNMVSPTTLADVVTDWL